MIGCFRQLILFRWPKCEIVVLMLQIRIWTASDAFISLFILHMKKYIFVKKATDRFMVCLTCQCVFSVKPYSYSVWIRSLASLQNRFMANCWSRAQPVSSGEVLFYWQESCNAPFIGWSIFVTIVSLWCIYPVQTWVLCIFVYSLSLAVIFCPSTLPEGLWTQPCCLLGDISEVFLLVQTS